MIVYDAFCCGVCVMQSTISASLRDKSVDGLAGLNIRATFPFKFDDYVVGFKHSFTSFGRAPDALFVRRSIDTGDAGTAQLEAEYNTLANVGSYSAGWASKKYGVAFNVQGDTKNYFRNGDVSGVHQVGQRVRHLLKLLS
jgi:hypothetical protein